MTTEVITAETLPRRGAEHLGRLMVGSFRFSQGSVSLQTSVLQYATHETAYGPTELWEASELAEKQALEVLERSHGPNLGSNFRGNEEETLAAFNDLRRVLEEIMETDERPPKEQLIPEIRSSMLDRDHYFAKQGRRYVGTPDGGYFSYFARYAILGQATGSVEYDGMFSDLKDEAAGFLASEAEDLDASLAVHARFNPDDVPAIEAWLETISVRG